MINALEPLKAAAAAGMDIRIWHLFPSSFTNTESQCPTNNQRYSPDTGTHHRAVNAICHSNASNGGDTHNTDSGNYRHIFIHFLHCFFLKYRISYRFYSYRILINKPHT